MKKQIIALSVMLASALSLTNCAKEELVPATPSEGTPFSLTASIADTKTANDGLKTTWVADDAINLFHAAAGTTAYVNDGSFTVSDVETGKFDGTLAGELTAESYDWYAFYPYSNYIKAPDGSAGYWPLGHAVTGTAYPLTATQQGNDNTAHLAGQYMPLYATATVSASEQVSLNFKNLASVVKIIITNTVDEPLIVSSVKFTSTEDIVGTFKYDLTSEPVKYESSGTNYTGPTASLTVENGTAIAKGASAAFYIPVKPHIAANGSTLKISVNGYEKTLELPKDVTFTAGSIKPLKFDYDKEVPQAEFYTKINSLAEFNPNVKTIIVGAKADGTTYIHGDVHTSNYLIAVQTKIEGNQVNYDGTPIVFEPVNDKYYIKYGDNYLSWSSGNTVLVGSTKDEWTLSYDNTKGLFKIDNSTHSGRVLQFNQSSPRFACYTESQANVSLYQVLGPDTRVALNTPQNILGTRNEDDENVTNSIDVVWDEVANAASYEVTATPTTGTAKTETVTTNSHTFTGLAYDTEYTISVIAKPVAGSTEYKNSEAGIGEDKVRTGLRPDAGKPITVTFTAGTDTSDETSITKEDVTISLTFGVLNRTDNYRVYAGASMTISVSNGKKISKIETVEVSGNQNLAGDGFSRSGANGTWTGNASSVTLSASKQSRITSIKVTFE